MTFILRPIWLGADLTWGRFELGPIWLEPILLGADLTGNRNIWHFCTASPVNNFCSRKRDSSLNQILGQFRNVQPLNLLHQRTLSRLCNGVNTAPKYGLLGLMPCCRFVSRFIAFQVFWLQCLMRQRMYRSFPVVKCEVFHSFGGHSLNQVVGICSIAWKLCSG
jgi:hypothetical protein